MDRTTELQPVVDALLDEYELTVDSVTPVRFTNNAVFRLSGPSGEYALRLHRPGYRTKQQIWAELTYLAALAVDGGFTVPLPVGARSGDFVSTVEVSGQRGHGSVVTWLDGQVRRPGSGAGPRTLHRIGQALGGIHNFSEAFATPVDFELPTLDLFTGFASVDLDQLGEAVRWEIFDEVRQRVDAVFDGLTRSASAFGVLHNDFILLNCLHHGRRTAVIDFDDCGWGFYLQDLGGMLSNLKDYPDYQSLRRWFLDGYRSVRPLPSEDEQDLELMIALRHCASTLWLLNRHQEGAIAEDQFQRILNYRINEIQSSLEALEDRQPRNR